MSYRFLVVDDDPAVLKIITEVLRREGHAPVGAASFDAGRQALEAGPPPDVLVTDVRLGDYNGLQLVLMKHPATAAIVMSGFRDEVLEAEAAELGAPFLVKPVSRDALMQAVADVTRGREAGSGGQG
jgi:DNA-binding NtrC family response regulator